jgi:hypothetical protein
MNNARIQILRLEGFSVIAFTPDYWLNTSGQETFR